MFRLSSTAFYATIFLPLLLILGNIYCCEPRLTVGLSRKSYVENGMTLVTFCIDCPTPHLEGSLKKGLHPKHGLQEFEVIGTLVYCIPNSAEGRKVLNAHHFRDRIVLIDRGAMGLLDKVERILESGAVGVIIADDGRCREDLSYCGPQAGSVREGGFAINDDISRWRDVDIPVVLVTVKTADVLRETMGIRRVEIPKYGWQNLTIFHHGKEQYRDEL